VYLLWLSIQLLLCYLFFLCIYKSTLSCKSFCMRFILLIILLFVQFSSLLHLPLILSISTTLVVYVFYLLYFWFSFFIFIPFLSFSIFLFFTCPLSKLDMQDKMMTRQKEVKGQARKFSPTFEPFNILSSFFI